MTSDSVKSSSARIDRRDSFVYDPPHLPPFERVYHDDDIMVLNKPAGLLTVPGRLAEHKDSLELRIKRVYPTASIVHRLDMATSGLLVLPLNRTAHKRLQWQFEDRIIKKTYHAVVMGHIDGDEGVIDAPLITDWPRRPMQKICQETGKPAQTHYHVLDRTQLSDEDNRPVSVTRVALKPITGRTHQLRVHLLSIGHVICGDRLYADDDGYQLSPRLLLHAHQLSLKHPITREPMTFTSDTTF